MGAVYRAFDDTLQRSVAIKRLLPAPGDPNRTLRFRREARMAARLNHPAIVHIYEIVETPEGDWIVMELVEGKTLDRLLRESRLDLHSAVRVAREIADGLAEAHLQGIVHRDLKAANVMVASNGRVKILDFGLAKAYDGDTDQEISTPGTILGTCHAMSPEQAQGHTVDHRSDLFSLGSLLYEMLTGQSPFHGATTTETLARICAYEPELVSRLEPAVPRELSDLTHQLLQKSAAKRPQHSGDVAATLERIERSGHLSGGPRPAAALATEVVTSIDRPSATPVRPATPAALTSIERRQVTVLCCELADASQPAMESGHLFDPEMLYELMLQVRPLVQQAAQRYDGSIGPAVGHRLVAYFGYPQAHEDDAWRAVRTALDLVGEVTERLDDTPGLGRVSPALRVAIHTGTAVVSTVPHAPEPVVLGATLDVVMRLLASAEPGAVVLSPATRSLVHRGVAAEPLPPLPPSPGSGVAMVPYRVREGQDSGEEAVFDLAPLIGRDREIEHLLVRWDQVQNGIGQAVLLTGEPGIGKSRLLRAFRERVRDADGGRRVRFLQTHGTPYTQNTPLHAVVQWLHRTIASEPGTSIQQRLASLDDAHGLGEAYPLLASLLEFPERPDRPLRSMPPERQREETLDALVALLLEMSARDPVVLVVEDLHWLDATTLAWLDRLVDQTQAVPLYLVMTLRPNTLDVPWAARAQVTQITLGALTQDDTEQLIRSITGDRRLGSQLQEQIVARTDGVPLFVEELTRSVLESGEAGQSRELPTTLRDSLTARLSRLGSAREIAQLASVIGRSFSMALLTAVSPHPPDQLDRELRQLVQSGLVHRRGFGAQARYAFKHALVRDAAYDSLVRRERQHLHLRIADALHAQRRIGAEDVPGEVLAHHYMAGEQFDQAFRCWLETGRLAMSRSAHAEAIGHLEQALAALQAQRPSAARDSHEIDVRSALATSLGVIRGLSSPELVATYDRLLSLTGHLGDVPHELYFNLWNFYASRGRLQQALDLSRQRLAYGVEHGDTDAQLLGIYTAAASEMFLGHFEASRDGFDQLLAIYPTEGLATRTIAYDIGAVAQSLLGDVLWVLGLQQEGADASESAIGRGRACSPFTESVALVDRMMLAVSMRDDETVQARAAALIALSQEHGYQYWTVFWQLCLAVTKVKGLTAEAAVEAALEEATTAISIMRTAYGSNLQCTRYLSWVVEACLDHGRLDKARGLLDDALTLAGADGERYWLAELRRLEARLRQAQDAPLVEVETLLRAAIDVAREQSARTFEQRAATALEPILRDQGRGDEVDSLLVVTPAPQR